MTQKEKDAAAREALEWWEHEANPGHEPITIVDPCGEYAALAARFGSRIPAETRRESYVAIKPDAAARRYIIYEILRERGGMTAQEVATELYRRGLTPSDERNFAAPRLTELKEAGLVEATGKKICEKTGRSVTVWAVRKEASTLWHLSPSPRI